MVDVLFVGLGGFLGAILRYLISVSLASWAFPLGTLVVNVLGSFAMGWVAGLVERGSFSDLHRQFVAVGLLGGLTTFSTFSLETIELMKAQSHGAAVLSVFLNVALALLAARVGMALAG